MSCINPVFASAASLVPHDFTAKTLSWLAIAIFIIAYTFVILEDVIHLRKSKPVIVAAGLIWVIVAISYAGIGQTDQVDAFLGHNILEYAYLFLFLLVAMTYINTMENEAYLMRYEAG